jgi:hypothetical protein
MKIQLAIALLLSSTLVAEEPKVIIPTLSIEEQIQLSDINGVMNILNILKLKPTDNIKFYLSDGTELIGLVKETQLFNKEMFKVFGEIQNKTNTGFGFVLVKAGSLTEEPVFAGAVVFRDSQETYNVQYSEEAKGFMLIKTKNKNSNMKIAKKNSKNPLTDKESVL